MRPDPSEKPLRPLKSRRARSHSEARECSPAMNIVALPRAYVSRSVECAYPCGPPTVQRSSQSGSGYRPTFLEKEACALEKRSSDKRGPFEIAPLRPPVADFCLLRRSLARQFAGSCFRRRARTPFLEALAAGRFESPASVRRFHQGRWFHHSPLRIVRFVAVERL